MATIITENALRALSNGSPLENGMRMGPVAGLSYHFLFQSPRQADVLKCLLAVASYNIMFILMTAFVGPILSGAVGCLVFNLTFVRRFEEFS